MKNKKHTIIPLVGTDQLKIGSTRETVRNEYSELYGRSVRRGSSEIDDYGWFHAYFENDKLCAVEFFEPCEIYFEDVQLIGTEFEVCKKLFLQKDNSLRIEDNVGFSSTKLQVGVYAPYGAIETVLVAKSGYYL